MIAIASNPTGVCCGLKEALRYWDSPHPIFESHTLCLHLYLCVFIHCLLSLAAMGGGPLCFIYSLLLSFWWQGVGISLQNKPGHDNLTHFWQTCCDICNIQWISVSIFYTQFC